MPLPLPQVNQREVKMNLKLILEVKKNDLLGTYARPLRIEQINPVIWDAVPRVEEWIRPSEKTSDEAIVRRVKHDFADGAIEIYCYAPQYLLIALLDDGGWVDSDRIR